MRWVICALVALALASPAFAADLDILPGPQPVGPGGPLPVGPATFTRWSGFYVGGQLSYGDANADFSGATQPLVAYSLRELALENDEFVSTWPVLGRGGSDAVGYGGFVGYNTQWQDLIFGLEGNYTHTDFTTSASSSPISRVTSAGGYAYSVNLTGTGQLEITDYASLRARAGWVLGNVLPYGFAGLVIGRGNYGVTTEVSGYQNSATPAFFPCAVGPTCLPYDFSNGAGQNGALLYGFSVGGGLDWAITQNIFLRGEFEYVQFAPIANIVASIVSGRVGAGVKF
ncbi:MAG: outer membrane protein [Beijerinckiaceae bacterium]|jgi:outer membrane immunogenic protein